MAYTTGTKPGIGTYMCINCGQSIKLDNDSDIMPPCPTCYCITYESYNTLFYIYYNAKWIIKSIIEVFWF